jgi:hypothetical protein
MSQSSMDMKSTGHPHKSHRPLAAMTSVRASQTNKRRSTRMALNARVGLTGEDRQKNPFNLPARATNLNLHGAAVALHRELMVGSKLQVRNQRGMQLSARVVAQLAALQGVPTYAIEFLDKDDKAKTFWGISFPTNASDPQPRRTS